MQAFYMINILIYEIWGYHTRGMLIQVFWDVQIRMYVLVIKLFLTL